VRVSETKNQTEAEYPSAFTIVQGAFNWLVDNYPKMADLTASARRVASLLVALDDLEHAETQEGFEKASGPYNRRKIGSPQ
jgi:ABC-type uncharacterized transport system fused permease/ATPase subunit